MKKPKDLPDANVEIIAIGWKHINNDGLESRGYKIVEQVVVHAPSVVLYILPGPYKKWMYKWDIEALEEAAKISRSTRFFIVEFPQLRKLGTDDAVIFAKKAIKKDVPIWKDGTPHFLFPRFEQQAEEGEVEKKR